MHLDATASARDLDLLRVVLVKADAAYAVGKCLHKPLQFVRDCWFSILKKVFSSAEIALLGHALARGRRRRDDIYFISTA
jgi:hypothetical protein